MWKATRDSTKQKAAFKDGVSTDMTECPFCKDNLGTMSGIRLENHDDYPICLCFKCKIWVNLKGEMLQTI